MLNVKLAGYNVDTEVIDSLVKGKKIKKEAVSAETIAAAYARISRDPRPVGELRQDAREEVEKARKSNETIVFKMGHHSVAEHAYLNFDITGLSRYAVEALEEARLCSYTEKSQRYITLDGDYVVPGEFDAAQKKLFKSAVKKQVEAYKKAFPVLHEYQKAMHTEMSSESKRDQNTIEGWAKEDARYMLSMATECQLGFSANARNIEYIIRKLKYHPLEEVRELGGMLYKRAKEAVPSLIILSDPAAFKKQFGWDVSDGFLKNGRKKIEGLTKNAMKKFLKMKESADISGINLVCHTDDPDSRVIAALLYAASGKPYGLCLETAKDMKERQGQLKFLKEVFLGMTEYDAMPREFEAVNFVFEIKISSSAFAQMKRHRMMTILKQSYDPSLGYTVPPAIKATGLEKLFSEVMESTEEVYAKIDKRSPEAADYVLTNAHKRRILVNVNLRELYHIARLRMDMHAQWDIQGVTAEMISIVKIVAPVASALACGKDGFKKEYWKLFGGEKAKGGKR